MRSVKENILHLMREEAYRPMSGRELIKIFSGSKTERKIIQNILYEMEEEGLIYRTKKDRYGVPEKMNLYVGRLSLHQRGFGFLETQNLGEEDIFIPASSVNGAMNGDKVIVRKVRSETSSSKMEGEVIKITDRAVVSVVGHYEGSKNFGFVVPDDRRISEDIFVPKKFASGAKSGDVVVCKITEYPKKGRNAEGKVTEILGRKGDKDVDILSIIRQRKLPEVFPHKVQSEARSVGGKISEKEIQKRRDLRKEFIYTMDGEDAKDFDDAISIEKLPKGLYRLGVHIADVSHYVKEGSALDSEAMKRGTSVYLVDRVIPMLPKELSNGICSINPGEDRLALSCIMDVDEAGQVVHHEIVKSVICSKARLVYDEVSDWLEKAEQDVGERDPLIFEKMRLSEELAGILIDKRRRRGSIDFDFPESRIFMDQKGSVSDVQSYRRRIANNIIEEFMLLANETVAEQFFWMGVPFVYRTHEVPEAERLKDFMKLIAAFGYHLKGNLEAIHPKELQKLLLEIKGKKEEALISKLMLRSMRQARYAPICSGHFGLAAKYYCHFTSPIRRYPDLQIHRIIKEALEQKLTSKRIVKLQSIVDKVAVDSSIREREAEESERQVEDLRKAEYMKGHIGEVYEGRISSLTSFGIFVTLDNTVEGLIRLHEMSDDYYVFDHEHYQMIGEHTKKIYAIGDKLKVKVEGVHLAQREVNFSLVEQKGDQKDRSSQFDIEKS